MGLEPFANPIARLHEAEPDVFLPAYLFSWDAPSKLCYCILDDYSIRHRVDYCLLLRIPIRVRCEYKQLLDIRPSVPARLLGSERISSSVRLL